MSDKDQPIDSVSDMAIALAANLFPKRVTRIERVTRGVMNYKFRVCLSGDESYALRFYPSGRQGIVDFEPDLLRRSQQLGLPVPNVLVDSRAGPTVGLNYTVYRWIEGIPLDERLPFLNQTHLVDIARALVTFLKGFAELEVHGFGELMSATQARYRTWSEFLESNLQRPDTGVARHPLELEGIVALRAHALAADSGLTERVPVLAWGDISPENILLDANDRIVGLLDFEGAISADFSLTLGYCFARYWNTPFYGTLRSVWPECEGRPPEAAEECYALLRGLRLARYFHLPMPTGCVRQSVENVLPGFIHILRHLRQHHY